MHARGPGAWAPTPFYFFLLFSLVFFFSVYKWDKEKFGSIKQKREDLHKQIAELEIKEELKQITIKEGGELRNLRKELIDI